MKTLKNGDKFFRLTVLNWDETSKSWICECSCGKLTRSRAWSLKNGKHKSCGCLDKEEGRASARLPDNLGIKKAIFRNYKRAAKKRGYKFSLTENQFYDLIIQDCRYCDTKPNMVWKHQGYESNFYFNGVDRIDNSKGYEKNNVVPCCKICNNAKSTLTLEQFKIWIRKIYENYIR